MTNTTNEVLVAETMKMIYEITTEQNMSYPTKSLLRSVYLVTVQEYYKSKHKSIISVYRDYERIRILFWNKNRVRSECDISNFKFENLYCYKAGH
jgi:hypothetical protein